MISCALSDFNLNLSVEAENIDKKFAGLNWISPEFSKTPKEEIDKIKEIKNYLKNDPRKKMLITNYIFFSAILDEKLFSPSRAFTSDGTTHPLPGNKYFKNYRQLMTETIKKNQIEVIYIAGTLEDKHIYSYINRNCFKEKSISNMLRSYEVINCEDIKR